jgi:hypothetical protein
MPFSCCYCSFAVLSVPSVVKRFCLGAPYFRLLCECVGHAASYVTLARTEALPL